MVKNSGTLRAVLRCGVACMFIVVAVCGGLSCQGKTKEVTAVDTAAPAFIVIKKGGRVLVIDSQGKPLARFSGLKIMADAHELGLFSVKTEKGWKYLNPDGTLIPETEAAESLGVWAEGLVAVKLISSGKTGFMDIHGEMVIAPSYEEAGWFSEGLAPVKKGGKWGFIDKTGKVVWDFRYDLLLPPKRSIVESFLDGKRYWFNIRQEVLFTSDRSYRLNPLSDELVGLSLTGQPWIVLSSEKVVAGPERGYLLVRPFREGFAAVMRFSTQNVPRWGLIDIEGREVVSCSWEDITDASGNHVAVKSRGRWRFVDVLSGKVATGLEYKAVAYEGHEGYFLVEDVAGKKGTWSKEKGFSLWDSDSVGPWIWRDMFLVKKSGLKGVGNARTGQVIVPPLYEEIKWCEESSLLLVKQEEKTGYWGLHGEEIISPRYREGSCFVKNFAVVTEESGEKMIIDKMGNAKISLPQDTTKVFLPDGTILSTD